MGPTATDATRVALAMIRADWQGDEDELAQLWATADDPAAVARELAHLCRQNIERLAYVGGVSTGEMFHRMASLLVPHPDAGHVTVVEMASVAKGA